MFQIDRTNLTNQSTQTILSSLTTRSSPTILRFRIDPKFRSDQKFLIDLTNLTSQSIQTSLTSQTHWRIRSVRSILRVH